MPSKKQMKSGSELRAFRRKLARTSDSPPEKSIRTLKFPLEDTGFFEDPGNFDAAHRMYDITESIGEVSLYSYLMHLHLGVAFPLRGEALPLAGTKPSNSKLRL